MGRVNHQRGKSRQNVLPEKFCRLKALPIGEIFPGKDSDAVLFKFRQERSKARLLLLNHGDDYGAEICQ